MLRNRYLNVCTLSLNVHNIHLLCVVVVVVVDVEYFELKCFHQLFQEPVQLHPIRHWDIVSTCQREHAFGRCCY